MFLRPALCNFCSVCCFVRLLFDFGTGVLKCTLGMIAIGGGREKGRHHLRRDQSLLEQHTGTGQATFYQIVAQIILPPRTVKLEGNSSIITYIDRWNQCILASCASLMLEKVLNPPFA